MATLVKSETYVKSDPVNNNNKFWIIELFDDNSIVTKWGRVGDDGDHKDYPFSSQDEAQKFWDKKVKEKTRDGRNGEIAYRKADVIGKTGQSVSVSVSSTDSVSKIAKQQISSSDKETDKLIQRLVKENVHNITQATTMSYNVDTGLFSTPIGVVSRATLTDADLLLGKIADGVSRQKWDSSTFKRDVGDYLMLIPQQIGRRFDVREIFPDVKAIQGQKDILDSLGASIDHVEKSSTAPQSQVVNSLFSVKLELIQDAKEMDRIRKKFYATLHSGHSCSHLKPKQAWTVEIKTMKEAFDAKGAPIGNIQEYYHGSKVSNILSILSKGMLIVNASSANVCGRAYGNGLYFSSESSKSLNYSHGYWGGRRDNNCFMFMVDVAMGNPFTPRHSDSSLTPPKGFDSVWAKAGQSGVINHEMIVYKTYQANPTRLVEFE